jgi:hypothetical protein
MVKGRLSFVSRYDDLDDESDDDDDDDYIDENNVPNPFPATAVAPGQGTPLFRHATGVEPTNRNLAPEFEEFGDVEDDTIGDESESDGDNEPNDSEHSDDDDELEDDENPGVNPGVDEQDETEIENDDTVSQGSLDDEVLDLPDDGSVELPIFPEDINEAMDEAYGARSGAYNLRSRRPRKFDHLHPDSSHAQVHSQHSMKAGIRLFGDKGEAAVQSELTQLLDRKVMEPALMQSLTYQEKKRALPYLMFLKEKRDGKIKGRGCADGRTQRAYISKDESTSPTVSTEAVFLTSIVDAKERRDVATVDLRFYASRHGRCRAHETRRNHG